jgi:hypothetical protein
MESSIWMRNVFMEALDNSLVVSCPFRGCSPPLGPLKRPLAPNMSCLLLKLLNNS